MCIWYVYVIIEMRSALAHHGWHPFPKQELLNCMKSRKIKPHARQHSLTHLSLLLIMVVISLVLSSSCHRDFFVMIECGRQPWSKTNACVKKFGHSHGETNLRYSHPYYTLFDRIIKCILLNYKTKRGFLNLTSFTLYFIFVCLAKISLENFWTCNKSIFCSHSLLWQTTKINRVKVSSRLLWKKNYHQNVCN